MKPLDKRIVVVSDRMQSRYVYVITKPMGKDFDSTFRPELTPKELLQLGVFGGKYLTDCTDEFPNDWFTHAKLSPKGKNSALNYFHVNASQPLSVWRKQGWIYPEDPRGWFQWYCRYYMGRRIPDEDKRQIIRWNHMKRHVLQLQKHCAKGDHSCRPRQRQALLHWAYDARKI